jgi:predicted nuclease of predicted toxin-antitoxin system
MILLADESVDQPIVLRLRRDGHTVTYVAELQPGIADETVLEISEKSDALLVTSDSDFGELVFRQRLSFSGVVLLRLAGLSAGRKAEVVSKAVREHGREMEHGFSVIEPASIRIRQRIR